MTTQAASPIRPDLRRAEIQRRNRSARRALLPAGGHAENLLRRLARRASSPEAQLG